MVRFKVDRRSNTAQGLTVDEFLLQNRWILVEFLPLPYPNQQSTALNSKQIYAALKQSVIVNFGDTGWGAVGSSLNGMTLVHMLVEILTERMQSSTSPLPRISASYEWRGIPIASPGVQSPIFPR
jgi:hypothetical protein